MVGCKNDTRSHPLSGNTGTTTTTASVPQTKRVGIDPRPTSSSQSPIGTNLDFVTFKSTAWPFLDAIKLGTRFNSVSSDGRWDERRISTDRNGWPLRLESNQRASTLIPSQEGGEMVVRWVGRGSVEIAGTEQKLEQVKVTDHRIDFVAVPNQDLDLAITATDPEDPVRNVRVVQKKYEDLPPTKLFHPKFIERLEPFQVLRFMDWGQTNASPLQQWKDRTRPDTNVQSTTRGVAYEHMIALANATSADAWFCIPHKADDDFVEQFAKLILAKLHKDALVYIEYSNEIWNGHPAFLQSQYAVDMGTKLKLSDNRDIARLRFQSLRSVAIFKIFEKVFNGTERLVRVIGSQTGNHYAHQELLAFGEARAYVDAIAIAPYFGDAVGSMPMAKKVMESDVEWLMTELETHALPQTLQAITDSTQWAKKSGVALIAYEGGQHLVAEPGLENDAGLNEKLNAANRHPKMKQFYLTMLEHWKAGGGQMFVHFNFVGAFQKYGRFGALERLDQDRKDAPKHDALLEFAEKNPRWW